MNIESKRISHNIFIYVLLCTSIALMVKQFVDLPPLIGNWDLKAKSILDFQLKDNYYPPGAALALIPFLWAGPNFWPAIFFYYGLCSAVYFKLCQFIPNRRLKVFALIALPSNSYLTWLCLTSADQVIELLTLLLFGLNVVKHRIALALSFGALLCLTRPAYWVVFIVIMYLLGHDSENKHANWKKGVLKGSGLVVLLLVLVFNRIVFGSANLSTSSADTIFFSHQKFHYLSLPKFDMDVFLKNGPSTNPFLVVETDNRLEYVSDIKTRAALLSIIDNPQRFIFAQMQKVDSYFFSIQKVPNLPGQYELAPDEKSILIGNERLTWSLTIGHFFYFLYRAIWLILFFASVFWLFILIVSQAKFQPIEKYLLLPYLLGVVPCLLFYVETRFKICSELLAIPLHFYVLSHMIRFIKSINMHQFQFENRS